jgi:hypothetical protein
MARAQGIVVGLGASWIKALTEPRHQSVAERILPPSPAQKQEVGADPAGRPENMPPAVLANRTAVALGHGGLTARQRLRVQEAIHYGFGAGLGVAYPVAAKRWRVSAGAEARSQGSRSMRALTRQSCRRSESSGHLGGWRRRRCCGSRHRTWCSAPRWKRCDAPSKP